MNKTYNCCECGDEYPIPNGFTGEPTICYSCAKCEIDESEQYREEKEADDERIAIQGEAISLNHYE
jgi:hypothetical protein